MNALQIILLTLSLHTSSQPFNNQNYGIGVEYTDDFTYGIYAYENSYHKQSIMVSFSKQWDHFGVGVAAANAYQEDVNAIGGEYLIAPELTVRYGPLRIKTSAPFGTLIGSYDVVNLQVVIPWQ